MSSVNLSTGGSSGLEFPDSSRARNHLPSCVLRAITSLTFCSMSLLGSLVFSTEANAIGEVHNTVIAHSSRYGLPPGELRSYTGSYFTNTSNQDVKTPYLWVAGDDEVVAINAEYKGRHVEGRLQIRDSQGYPINTQHFLTYDIDNDGIVEAVASGPQGVFVRDLLAQSLPFVKIVSPHYAINDVRVIPMPRMVGGGFGQFALNGFLAVENGIIRSYHYPTPGNLVVDQLFSSTNSNFGDFVIPRDPAGYNQYGYGVEFITVDGGDIRILNARTGQLARRANFLLHPGAEFLGLTTIDKNLEYYNGIDDRNVILASIYNYQTGYGSFVTVDTADFARYEWSGTVPSFLAPQGQFQTLENLRVSSLGNPERPVFWGCADTQTGPGPGNASIVAFPLTPDNESDNLLSLEGQETQPFGITGCDTFHVNDVDGDGNDEFVSTRNEYLVIGKAGGGFSRQVPGSSTGQLPPLDLSYDYDSQELVIKLQQGVTFNMLNNIDSLTLFGSTDDAEFAFPALLAGGGQTLRSGLNPATIQTFPIDVAQVAINTSEVRVPFPILDPAIGNRPPHTLDSSGRPIPTWTTVYFQVWMARYTPVLGSQPAAYHEALSNSISVTAIPAME